MASSISFSNHPYLSSRFGSLTTIKPNLVTSRPALSVSCMASATGGKKRYMGTVKRERVLSEMIEKKVAEAIKACEGNEESEGCRVAWDEVEEVSMARADLRRRIAESGGADPLERFCEGNPESDECVVCDYYDD